MEYTFQDKIDLRTTLAEARDQGERGTCVAFAVTSCHEHHRNTDIYLSEEFLYRFSKIIDGDDEEGTLFDSAFIALKRWGQAQRELLPYNELKAQSLPKNIEQIVLEDGLLRRISSAESVDNYISTIENLLDLERTVAIGVEIHDNFYIPNNGYIDLPDVETSRGGHAILIVGYGIRSDQKKYFIIRNSWGKSWGEQGYAFLSYEYLEKYKMGNAWYIERRATS